MSQTDKSVQLISEVLKTHKKIGLDKTIKSLIEARMDPNHFRQLVEDKIIYFVCKIFKIKREDLLQGTSKGNRTDAIMVVYVLLKKHLDYSLQQTNDSLKKDKSVISKSISTFNRLRHDIKQESIILKKHEQANKLITEFIINEKLNQDGTSETNS